MKHPINTSLYKRLVKAKLFIDAHYDKAIDLDEIAGHACFSKFHFIRLFKKVYGKTPHQYLTAVRIEQAGELLKAGTPVNDVCFNLGFVSVSSFSGLFKRRLKLSPAAYRMQALKRKTLLGQDPLKFIPGCFAKQNGWTKKSNFKEAV